MDIATALQIVTAASVLGVAVWKLAKSRAVKTGNEKWIRRLDMVAVVYEKAKSAYQRFVKK